MEEYSTSSLKIERLSKNNFHAWKQRVQLVLVFRDLDGHIKKNVGTDENEPTNWNRNVSKARAIIGLSLSDEHLEHARDTENSKTMWGAIMNVSERHTLLNNLSALRKFYTVKMGSSENVLAYLNRVIQLAAPLKAMKVDIEDEEMAMAALNGLPSKFKKLIVALDALGNEDEVGSFEFVKSRLLQEEQRANERDMLDEQNSSSSALVSKLGDETNLYRPIGNNYHCTNCGRGVHTVNRC